MMRSILRADQKEQAEHLMLVDLARNDVSKVCEPGSVEVTEFMEVEFMEVMQFHRGHTYHEIMKVKQFMEVIKLI